MCPRGEVRRPDTGGRHLRRISPRNTVASNGQTPRPASNARVWTSTACGTSPVRGGGGGRQSAAAAGTRCLPLPKEMRSKAKTCVAGSRNPLIEAARNYYRGQRQIASAALALRPHPRCRTYFIRPVVKSTSASSRSSSATASSRLPSKRQVPVFDRSAISR